MNNNEVDIFYSQHKSELNKTDDLEMPNESNSYTDIHELLDNTDPKHIYLSGDWHFFKHHYKKEHNYVNTKEIVAWCKQNIKPTDVFMYLGDISFRYANEEDQKESQRIMASIPGIKVLILGNHDMMLGQDYFTDCGFNYVFENIDHKNIIYTHKPINIDLLPEGYINIHAHMHKWNEYNTTDGKRNINVYPWYYNNKPVTLDYCINHINKLTKDNKRSNWTQIGENNINLETSRANLKDNQFGIPEDRKFPLDSEKHIKSAIKLFGHAEESKKKALAKRIKTAANNYNIKIPETTQVYKYLSEASIDKIDIPIEVENIVFDMGGVLVNSDLLNAFKNNKNIPDKYCEEICDIINKLFYKKENPSISHYNIDQIKKYFENKVPEHIKPFTSDIFESFLPAMYIFNYTHDLINAFKSRGYKIYYLSNWDRYSFELEYDFFKPLIEKFDGGLFSYECHIEKPVLSIYTLFTNKFNLEPNKCLFFDDKQENINAAKICGWHGIVFDNKITPSQLFKTIYSKSNINFSNIGDKNKILAISEDGLSYIDISKIKFWYVASVTHPKSIDESSYSSTLNDAITESIKDSEFNTDDNQYVCNKYVFTKDKNNEYIYIGCIMIFKDNTWEWIFQKPVNIDEDGNLFNSMKNKINEWSMAAMNPIVGITKPFILKMCNDSSGIINTKQYALAPDLISDKYLVINENANLEIIDSSNINNTVIEEYEFIGDKRLIRKIEEAYYSSKIVDNTFFYTALTGKPMLSEDQIDFDSNFKKVDFYTIKEKELTQVATLNEQFMKTINENTMSVNVIPNEYVKRLLCGKTHITIMEDLNGYYVFNTEKNIRSASISDQNFITEQMIYSVL